jgi:hypothetical protein
MKNRRQISDSLTYIVEKTIGRKCLAIFLLRFKLIPAWLFIGFKVRYLVRENDEYLAADLIRRLVHSSHSKSFLKLHTVMSAYNLEISRNVALVNCINELKNELVQFDPVTPSECYRTVYALIRVCEFERARKLFEIKKGIIREDNVSMLSKYFYGFLSFYLDDLINVSDIAWVNSLSYSYPDLPSKRNLIFYIPPVVSSLNAVEGSAEDVYGPVVSTYINLLRTIPREKYNVIVKIQFSWRYVAEPESDAIVISYHTHGPESGFLRIKESPLRGYCNIDRCGYSGWHSFSSMTRAQLEGLAEKYSDEVASKIHNHFYENFVVSKISKYAQGFEEIRYSDYIFLPLQVVTDVVSDLAYIRVIELLDFVIEICNRNNLNILIKRHPKCRSIRIAKSIDKIRKYRNVQVFDGNVHDAIKGANKVVTVNSGVGFEALLQLKTVITTGLCDYSVVTHVAKNEVELERCMVDLKKIDEKIIKKYFALYADHSLFASDVDFETVRKRVLHCE